MRCFVVCLAVSVPPAQAEPIDGQALFLDFCAACHGETAASGASGDIRGLGHATVADALNGIDQMPGFDFTDAEVAALADYLAELGRAD